MQITRIGLTCSYNAVILLSDQPHVMNKHLLRLFSIAGIFTILSLTTRAGSISGRVKDDAGLPVTYANIILLRCSDSALVTAQLTNEKGDYLLTLTDTGSFYLKAVLAGYEPYSSSRIVMGSTNVTMQPINLKPKENQLKEVAIRSQKPFIEVHADKLVVNVENSIVDAGGSVLDVLSHSPGVTVDQNDNISLKGKQGVNVMINGKIQPVSAADLANMLKSMPSSAVESIELISNPPAKYDAAGTGGIINIRMKKDKKTGLNGSINGMLAEGIYFKSATGLNLNYRNKNINIFGSYNLSPRHGFNHLTLDRNFLADDGTFSKRYVQDNHYLYKFNTYMANAGIDYNISRSNTIGCSMSADLTDFRRDGYNYSDVLDSLHNLTHFATNSSSPNKWGSYAGNINFKHSFDSTGRSVSIDADYAAYPGNGTQAYNTTYLDGAGAPSLTLRPVSVTGSQIGVTRIRSLKADYSHPLKHDARLEAGLKTSLVTADNDLKLYNVVDTVSTIDNTKSNHFIYNELINAAYINYSRDWKKWSTQLGLRAEQTVADGTSKTTGEHFDTNYVKLFPSFAVQRHLNANNDLGLTLSRRIERPNYEQLNPFKYYLDPTTYKAGYPYLFPALSYSFELSYTYKQRLVTTINYTRTGNPITEVIQPDDSNKSITVQTTKNLQLMEYFGVSGSYQFRFFKWWNNTTNINAYYSKYTGDIAGSKLDTGRATFDVYTTNSFVLPKNMSAEVSFFYQAPQAYGYMQLKPQSNLSIGFQKNFFDKKLTVKVNATDIFWHGYPSATSIYNNYIETFTAKRDTRQFSLALTYRFGKRTVSPVQRHGGGAEDEKKRAGGQGG